MPPAWGLLGVGLTTWGSGNDHGWPHMTKPFFPVADPIYFYALCSPTRKDPKYIPPSPWRFLSMLVKKQCPGHMPGKTRSAVYVSDRVLPRKTSCRIGKGSWDSVDVWDVLLLTHIGCFKPCCLA